MATTFPTTDFAIATGSVPTGASRVPGGFGGLSVRWVATPVGPMLAAAGDAGVVLLEFDDGDRLRRAAGRLARHDVTGATPRAAEHLDRLASELAEYFAGDRRAFAVPVVIDGTDFERRAWSALGDIPFGRTRTYGEQARSIGLPQAARAVGAANGRNRVAIVLPCHRVVGGNGSLTGYGGGLARKQWLLAHERRVAGDGELWQ